MQKGAAYQLLSPEVQRSVELHVAAHRARLLQQMGPHAAPSVTPAETLNYKDAPPDIQRQIEQQAGLTPSTEPPDESEQQQEGATQEQQPAQQPQTAAAPSS